MIENIKKDIDYLYKEIVLSEDYFVELVQIHIDDDSQIKTYYISSKYDKKYDGVITLRYDKEFDKFIYKGKEVKEPRKSLNIKRYDVNDKLIYSYDLCYDKNNKPQYATRSDYQKFYHNDSNPLAIEIVKELSMYGIEEKYIFGWAVKKGFLSVYINPKFFYNIHKEELNESI